MTIAMAASLIAGSTYAIFTSESKTNIAVNAGKVKVVATAEITDAWSALWSGSKYDENHELSEYTAQDGDGYIFTNGGTVVYNESQNTVNLNNITPGDGVALSIGITNYSNVKTQYRIEVSTTNDDGLFEGLDISYKMGNEEIEFSGENPLYTGWTSLEIPNKPEDGEDVGTFNVSIELPITNEDQNKYQEKSCDISINVFAVQWNGYVEDPEQIVDENADVTVDSKLISKVTQAANKNGISSQSIVFGSMPTATGYSLDGITWDDGIAISGINAKLFNLKDEIEGYDNTFYVLAKNSMLAAEESDLKFADSDYTYVDLSGVDFSNTTKVGDMFKNSKIETLVMQEVDLSKATDLESMFSGCTALKSVDFSKSDLSSLEDNHTIVGGAEVSAIHYLFEDCEALTEVNFSGVDLSGLTNMDYAFAPLNSEPANKTLLKANFAGANLSNVNKMARMFGSCAALEEVNFENAYLSNVKTVLAMFANCSKLSSINFNGADLSHVTTMEGMLNNCDSLKSVDFSGYDLSSVTTTHLMLAECDNLTSVNFSGVNLSSVEYLGDMMFYNCPKLESIDFSGANLSNAGSINKQNATGNFVKCSSLKSVNFANADLSNATTLWATFSWCSALKSVDFAGAKLGNVTTMESMFSNCTGLESFVGVFKDCALPNLKIMKQMFDGCKGLTTVDFSDMDLSGITDMSTMFSNCTELATVKFPENKDLSSVTDMGYMFASTKITSVDFTGAKLGKLSTVTQMFNGAPLEKAIFTHADLSSITDLSYMFQFCSTIKEVDFSYANLSGYVTMDSRSFANKNSLISANFSHAIFTNLTSLQYMFNHCTSLEHVYFYNAIFSDPENGSGSKVTTMYGMFNDCPKLISVDLSGTDLSKVTTTTSLFAGCAELAEVNFSNIEFSSGLTNISVFGGNTVNTPKLKTVDFSNSTLIGVKALGSLFKNCTLLESVDFSGAKLGIVTGVSDIFTKCEKLQSVNFSGIDFSGCSSAINHNPLAQFDAAKTTLEYLNFSGCNMSNLSSSGLNSRFSAFTALEEVNLFGAKMPTATQTNGMFSGCTSLTTVYLWQNEDLLKLTNTSNMFYNCSNLEHIYVDADINLADSTTLSTSSSMFNGCANLPNWNSKVDKTNAHTGEGGYFTVKEL